MECRAIGQGKGVVHDYETTPFFSPDLPALFQCPLQLVGLFSYIEWKR